MKSYLFPAIALLLLLALWITACSRGPTSTDESTPSLTESDETVEETPLPMRQPQQQETIMTPQPSLEAIEVTPPADAEHVVLLAKEDLANRLNLAPEAIQLVSVEPVDWPDASLGCPEPGMMYAQVITPGFRVVLEADRQGMYEYHSDRDDQIILCPFEGGSQVPPTRDITDSTPWQPVEPIEPDSLSPTPRR